ncbi:MAG: TetR family transcriptional regulator, partial [Alphaproteobacteria bacterium]|nr:TetR family transcriptional regulator [Alphaproteobacteria bacterium]
RTNDPEAVRRDILEVATREFAFKGLSGARIDEIAAQTNTSKRMIYYYFGGKEQLYRAVLAQAYQQVRSLEVSGGFAQLAPRAGLEALIRHSFDYHDSHPEFVRLVMNENIHHGAHLAQVKGMRARNESVVAVLETLLEKGVEQGVFRSGIEPLDLHVTISALCFYNVSNRYTVKLNFGFDMSEKHARENRLEQIVAIIMAWVGANTHVLHPLHVHTL